MFLNPILSTVSVYKACCMHNGYKHGQMSSRL